MSHPYIPNSNDAISLININLELGHRYNREISFGDLEVKKIAGINPAPTSQLSLSDLIGKAAYWNKAFTVNAGNGRDAITDMIVYGDENLVDYYFDDGFDGSSASGGDVNQTKLRTYYTSSRFVGGSSQNLININTIYQNLSIQAVKDFVCVRPRAGVYANPPTNSVIADNHEIAYYDFTGNYQGKFTVYSGGSGTQSSEGGVLTIEDYLVVYDSSSSPGVVRIFKSNGSSISSYATISGVSGLLATDLAWDATNGLTILIKGPTDTSDPDSSNWFNPSLIYQESAAGSASFSSVGPTGWGLSQYIGATTQKTPYINSTHIFMVDPYYTSSLGQVSVYTHSGSFVTTLDISDVPYSWDGEDLTQTSANSGTSPFFGSKFAVNNNYIIAWSNLFFPTQPEYGTRTSSFSSTKYYDNLNYGSYVVRGCFFVFDASDFSYVQTLPPPYYTDMLSGTDTTTSYNDNLYPYPNYHRNQDVNHRSLRYYTNTLPRDNNTELVDDWGSSNMRPKFAHGSSNAANVFYIARSYNYGTTGNLYDYINVWAIDRTAVSRPTPY